MSTPTPIPDVWAVGDAYERYVGRWSRLAAVEFIAWLALPAGARWLDIGCGTGALSHTILAHHQPGGVTGVDPSAGFIAKARQQVDDARVEFCEGDAQALPFPDGAFDAAVSGLVLNFIPDPQRAVAEMRRVLRQGGTAAVYVWDYAGEMQFMRRFWDAAAELDPEAQKLDEGNRFPICRPEPLLAMFAQAGFDQAEYRSIDIITMFSDFDDLWSPFLGGQGPAPTYCCGLPDDRRDALRERLRQTLPTRPDGSINLLARAFAVRAVRAD
jgi:ubiquinone/menaquinone biosynthesis C-methylase UbiE